MSQITDLTNTEWSFNFSSRLTIPTFTFDDGEQTFNVNFSSNGQSFSLLKVGRGRVSGSNPYRYIAFSDGVSSVTVWKYDINSSTTVSNTDYQVFTISDGSDVTNSTLISYLTTCATQVIPVYSITSTLSNVTADVNNPSTISDSGTATLWFTADSGYTLPTSITVSGASYTWNNSTGVVVLSNPTGDVTISITAESSVTKISIDLTTLENYSDLTSGETYSITVVAKGNPNLYIDSDPSNAVSWTKSTPVYTLSTNLLTNCSIHGTLPETISEGETITVTVDLTSDVYEIASLSSITATNATVSNLTKITDTQYSFDISNPTDNVVLSVSASVIIYSVTYNLTNLTKSSSSPTEIWKNNMSNIYVSLNGDGGYAAPASNEITVTNATVSNYSFYGQSCNFQLTNITSDVTITASTTTYYNYPITVTTSNITASQSNPSTITVTTPVTLTFTTGTGYNVPDNANDITVTNATKGTYTKVSDTQCTLVISNPTDSVIIYIAGVPSTVSYPITVTVSDTGYISDAVLTITEVGGSELYSETMWYDTPTQTVYSNQPQVKLSISREGYPIEYMSIETATLNGSNISFTLSDEEYIATVTLQSSNTLNIEVNTWD